MVAGRNIADSLPQARQTIDEFLSDLRRRITGLPPNSKLSLDVATNGKGEIHNHRLEQIEDRGPLSLA